MGKSGDRRIGAVLSMKVTSGSSAAVVSEWECTRIWHLVSVINRRQRPLPFSFQLYDRSLKRRRSRSFSA